MELSHLRYFYEVAKVGSFTRASRTLRVSQPAISKTVKQLEQYHGLRFLDRGKKGVNLTPMGRLLFEKCQRVFAEFDDIELSLQSQLNKWRGELWLGASDNLCNYLLPPMIAEFRQIYPQISIRVLGGVSEVIKTQLKDFRVEMGLFYTPVREREFLVEKLLFIEFVVVVSEKLCKTKNPFLKDVLPLGYVGSHSTDYSRPYPALKMLKSLRVSPQVRVEANIQETQKRLVLEGIGYTVVPRHMVAEEIEKGLLREVRLPKRIGAELSLVKLKARTLSRVAEAWCDFVREKIAGKRAPLTCKTYGFKTQRHT